MTDYDMDLILANAEIKRLKAETVRLKEIIIKLCVDILHEDLKLVEGDLNGRCEVDKDNH